MSNKNLIETRNILAVHSKLGKFGYIFFVAARHHWKASFTELQANWPKYT
jgi:hypothetical protein